MINIFDLYPVIGWIVIGAITGFFLSWYFTHDTNKQMRREFPDLETNDSSIWNIATLATTILGTAAGPIMIPLAPIIIVVVKGFDSIIRDRRR